MTIRDLWDAGFPHAPAGFEAWGEGISDEVDSRGILGYAEVTADQGSIGGTFVTLTGLSVAATIPAGRRVKVTTMIQVSVDVVDDTTAQVSIGQDGASVGGRSRVRLVGNNRPSTLAASLVLAPASGSRTYTVLLRREVGTGTLTMKADADNKAWLLVEDIGPA